MTTRGRIRLRADQVGGTQLGRGPSARSELNLGFAVASRALDFSRPGARGEIDERSTALAQFSRRHPCLRS